MPERAHRNRRRPGDAAVPGHGPSPGRGDRCRRRRGVPAVRSAPARAGPAERWTARRSASSLSVASGVSRRAAATSRTTFGCWASRPSASSDGDRVELAAGGADGPLEVRRFGVEDPVQVAAQGARHLPRLELEQAHRRRRSAAGTSRPPPRSSRSRRPDPGASATTRAGRCRRAAPARTGASSGATTNSRWVRPPARLSEPRARNRPRSQAVAAVVGGGRPVRTRRDRGRRSPSRRLKVRIVAAASQPDGQAGDGSVPMRRRPRAGARGPAPRPTRSQAASGSMAASSARRAVTRSRSERDMSGRHAVRPTARRRDAALAVEDPEERLGQARRVVVVGVVRDRRRRRARAAGRGRPPAASGAGPARPSSPPAPGRRTGCWPRRRRRCPASCGRRAPRHAPPGRSRLGLAVLGRDVAGEDARARSPRAGPRGSRDEQAREQARVQAARAEHDQVGLGDGRERILGRPDVARASARPARCRPCA